MELNLGVCVLFGDRDSRSSDWPLSYVGTWCFRVALAVALAGPSGDVCVVESSTVTPRALCSPGRG